MASEPSLSKLLKCANDAALIAGKIQRQKNSTAFKIHQKDGWSNLVTEVDHLCQKKIIQHIEKIFPSHAILAEEEGAPTRASPYLWIIDPIDGTTNFAHGFPFFCATIAVAKDGVLLAGVVYDPLRDEMFRAVRGKGAFVNKKRLKVTKQNVMAQSLVATGFSYKPEVMKKNLTYFSRAMGRVRAVRRAGAAALDLAYVASGRLEAYWDLSLQPWDMAAGVLLVEEAGGKVTSVNGTPFTLQSRDVLASNGPIHGDIQKLLLEPL